MTKQSIAAKAVIFDDQGRVLLLREAAAYNEATNVGKYLVPGGRINPGEHIFDALQREVAEEAGVKVTVGRPLFVSEWFPVLNGTATYIVAIFFACKLVPGQQVALTAEHDDYAWVDPNNVPPQYDLPDSIKDLFAALLLTPAQKSDKSVGV